MNAKIETNLRTKEGTQFLDESKKRALEYVKNNKLIDAWTSFASDLNKNEELRSHPALQLGTLLMASGLLSTQDEMKKFIEDFE